MSRWSDLGKGVVGDTGWAVVLELVRIASTLVSFTLLGRTLGADGYGSYAALYAIIGPMSALASSGIGLALLEHIIRDGEDQERTFRSCLSLTLVLGSALVVLGTGLASLIVDLSISTIAAVFALEMLAFPVFLTAASIVRVRDGFGAEARYRTIAHLSRAIVLVVLFASDSLTIASYGVTNLVVTLVLGRLMVSLVSRRYKLKTRPGKIQRHHLKTSAVYSVGIVGLSIQTDGDKLLLASYGQTVATGLYSAAYRVVQLGLLPITAIVGATHHRFLSHDADRRGEHFGRALALSKIAFVYGTVVGVGLVVVAPLVPVLVGSEFDESVQIVRWLAPLVVIRGLAIFPLNGLMGLGKTSLRTGLLLASSALSLAIYVALIPSHSWRGAVIGTLVGEVALALTAWIALDYYQQRHDRSLARHTAPVAPSARRGLRP